MAKAKKEGPIAMEIREYENKIKEFQEYLKKNSIVSVVNKDGEISEEPESRDARHKEILVQIKMLDALPNWLISLKKLKEDQADQDIETRGDVEVPGMFKNR